MPAVITEPSGIEADQKPGTGPKLCRMTRLGKSQAGKTKRAVNYSRSYAGPVTIRTALVNSLNTITAELWTNVGGDSEL